MSRFNVCNLIELLTQLALVFAGASPHSRDNSVLTTMQSFEEVSPQHSVIAQFQGFCDVPTRVSVSESILISF